MKNIPNILTVGRLLTLPLLMALMMVDAAWAAWSALGIYTLGCITDWFDGYLARRFQVVSPFGQFLDPVADKIFIASVLLTLLANGNLGAWGLIPVAIILAREFLISGLREYFGPKNISFPVSPLAKWKTGTQMLSLGFLIMGDYGVPVLPINWEIGYMLFVAATILTLITGWSYLREGIRHL